jgi:hypothetical protein
VSANTRSSTGDDDCGGLVVVLGVEEEEEEEEEESSGAGAVEQEGSKPSCCAHLGCLNSNMMFAPRIPASQEIQAEEKAPHSSTIYRDESTASPLDLSTRKNSSARCKTTDDAKPERQAKQHTAMFDCCCCACGGMLAPNPNPSAAEETRIDVGDGALLLIFS